MIFASVNELGEPAYKLVMDGRKTVTRRIRPAKVGAVRAVQERRTGKAIGHIRIVSVMRHSEWVKSIKGDMTHALADEVQKEGFHTLGGFNQWFIQKGININDCWRIEFEKVD